MTTTRVDATSAGPDAPASDRRWLTLAVMLAAAFMDLLDVTIVNVAIPAIQVGLGASYEAVQWTTAGYTLAFGLCLIIGGRLGDRYGRKRVFLLGVAAFTAASALCGLAQAPSMLVAGRLLQGAAAALMIPQIMATIFATFPARERGAAAGAYGGVTGLAAVAGPLLGGALSEYNVLGLGWRAVFLINVPVGLVALFAGTVLVPDTRERRPPGLDLVGAALVTVSMLLLLYPLVQGRELGWPLVLYLSMAASPVVLGGYALHARATHRRRGVPLVPLGLLRHRGFTAGLFLLIVFDAAMIAFALALSVTLQNGLGFSAFRTGLAFLAWSVGTGISSGLSSGLTMRFGRRVPTVGALVMAAGTAWTALQVSTGTTAWWSLAPGLFVFGVGMGAVIGPAFTIAGSGVTVDSAGAAAGTLNAGVQIGAATGTALLGVLFFNYLEGGGAGATAAVAAFHRFSWFAVGALVLVAALAWVLPRRIDTGASNEPS